MNKYAIQYQMENKQFLNKIQLEFQQSHMLHPFQDFRQSLIHQSKNALIPQISPRNHINQNILLPQQHQLKDLSKWDPMQIRLLFEFYDLHGPQWKKMSIEIPWRTANNLKNKFYTILRNTVKIMLRKNSALCPRFTGQISSKDLCRLYDGREKYEQYAGFLKDLLKEVDYDLEKKEIDDFVINNAKTIKKIYLVIYQDRIMPNVPRHEINRVSAPTVENNIQNPNQKQNPVIDQREEYQGTGQNMGYQNVPQNFYMVWIPNEYLNWFNQTY